MPHAVQRIFNQVRQKFECDFCGADVIYSLLPRAGLKPET